MRGDVIAGSGRTFCGCGAAMEAASGMLFCPECLRSAGAATAAALRACHWRGRSGWTAAEAARLPTCEAEECLAIYGAVKDRVPPDRIAEAAALWCSFRDAAFDAIAIYGRDGIEEHGRRYHWRWAIHRMEWSAGSFVGRISDEGRELGWHAMNAVWGPY